MKVRGKWVRINPINDERSLMNLTHITSISRAGTTYHFKMADGAKSFEVVKEDAVLILALLSISDDIFDLPE